MKLFLDDVRHNYDCLGYMSSRIGSSNVVYKEKWEIVRNHQEFCKFVDKHKGEITHVSFDHDLEDSHYTTVIENPGTSNGLIVDLDEAITGPDNDPIFSYRNMENTGYDSAKYLIKVYEENNLPLPKIFVHSMNPVGRINIERLFQGR